MIKKIRRRDGGVCDACGDTRREDRAVCECLVSVGEARPSMSGKTEWSSLYKGKRRSIVCTSVSYSPHVMQHKSFTYAHTTEYSMPRSDNKKGRKNNNTTKTQVNLRYNLIQLTAHLSGIFMTEKDLGGGRPG